MATQKVRPDPGRDERQKAQRGQVSRTLKVGTIAIAAIMGAIVVLVAVVAVRPGEQNGATPLAAGVSEGGTPSTATSTAAPPRDTSTVGLPPEGATPSKPVRGRLARWKGALEWDGYVYADGRWIYSDGSNWVERRLTPKGVDFLRFAPQPVHPDWLPASAWEDREPRPYVASRYVVVATYEYLFGEASHGEEGHPPIKHELPTRIQDFLRRWDWIVGSGFEMTTSEARRLAQTLSESGFKQTPSGPGVINYTSGHLFGIDFKRHYLVLELRPVLPDGRVPSSH
jgi:hypothetical protein